MSDLYISSNACIYKNGDEVIKAGFIKGGIGSFSLFFLNVIPFFITEFKNKTWVASDNCKYFYLLDIDYDPSQCCWNIINRVENCNYAYVLKIDNN
ncbi:hypothetical protein CWC16_19875, partial [Pseudoalteromonas sp. S3776]